MTKYFEQKYVSQLPDKDGYYNTNKGELFFHVTSQTWDIRQGQGSFEYPSMWWLPVEPKGMTLEEVKDRFAKTKGYDDFKDASNSDFGFETLYLDDIAELYLSSNTAALREENERKDSLIETAVKTSFLKDDEIKQLEQQLNIAKGCLEGLRIGLSHAPNEWATEAVDKIEQALITLNK